MLMPSSQDDLNFYTIQSECELPFPDSLLCAVGINMHQRLVQELLWWGNIADSPGVLLINMQLVQFSDGSDSVHCFFLWMRLTLWMEAFYLTSVLSLIFSSVSNSWFYAFCYRAEAVWMEFRLIDELYLSPCIPNECEFRSSVCSLPVHSP